MMMFNEYNSNSFRFEDLLCVEAVGEKVCETEL